MPHRHLRLMLHSLPPRQILVKHRPLLLQLLRRLLRLMLPILLQLLVPKLVMLRSLLLRLRAPSQLLAPKPVMLHSLHRLPKLVRIKLRYLKPIRQLQRHRLW
ncbi:hypothetical protein [Aeromonas phage Akh-2]|nr:hypothetical protein [Aeromonas phage Akh-2]